MARSGLGKGLGALIGTPSVAARTDGDESGERGHQIDLAAIVPSALQPRKDFAREALQELIDSIRQHGIIQPLIVRQSGTRLELIAGERRWRAAQEIGLARAAVTNAMRLLDLHPQVQIWVTQNLISVGHAKVLLALKSSEEQLLAAETI